jgi:hypothetical protein
MNTMADDQLDELHVSLVTSLENLVFNFDVNYWIELDRPSARDLEDVAACVRHEFRFLINTYRDIPSIRRARIFIEKLLVTGLNVPFPVAPEQHCFAVIENTMDAYYDVVYQDMRIDIIKADLAARSIQVKWKDAITNPRHPACRRRLMREYEELNL